MIGGTQKWLGWPVWLVTALLIVSALTGTAGPIQVLWLLGTIWVTASIVGIYLGRLRPGRRGRAQPEDTGRGQAPTEAPGSPVSHPGGTGSGTSQG